MDADAPARRHGAYAVKNEYKIKTGENIWQRKLLLQAEAGE